MKELRARLECFLMGLMADCVCTKVAFLNKVHTNGTND